MKAFYKIVLLVLAISTLVAEEAAMAGKIEVGGSQGWDASTDFGTWASAQTFKVGDQLEFKYSSLHSVVELANESAYKSCDITTSVNSMSTGNDVVKLDKPGTRYFACGTPGHCSQGMKVKVTVAAANGSPSSSSSSTPSSSSSSSSSASPASSSAAVASAIATLILVASLLGLQMLLFI